MLDPQSSCAKELSKLDVDDIIRSDVQKICGAATLIEITRILFLATRLQKTSEHKREKIKNALKKAAQELLARVETESGQLELPKSCRYLLLDI